MANLVKKSAVPLSGWEARKKEEISGEYKPKEPRPFQRIDPIYDEAIVIPWLSVEQEWEEIRFSLRSIESFWTDTECPIIIIGDKAPSFLKKNGRVQFIKIDEYAQSKEAGLWRAWQIGMQIAERVAWWNDDIYLLRETGWKDLEVALEEGEITNEAKDLRVSANSWKVSMGESVEDLLKAGKQKVYRFATHTPFLFERPKSVEIFETYHLNFKGSWVNLYHNHHRTPHKPCKPEKATKLPEQLNKRYYNHGSEGPDDQSRGVLEDMFCEPASWENDA